MTSAIAQTTDIPTGKTLCDMIGHDAAMEVMHFNEFAGGFLRCLVNNAGLSPSAKSEVISSLQLVNPTHVQVCRCESAGG